MLLCALSAIVAGCASRGALSGLTGGSGGQASLAAYIDRMREVSSAARPVASALATTLEASDPQLSAALSALAASRTAENHRRVASEYRRLGVLDMAHKHFTGAVQLDAHDAAAFDGLARIWRDWGFPQLGLGDAYRAVALAPDSAIAANTLGTLLEGSGRTQSARRWYERAHRLDPDASYPLINICYAAIMMGERDAVDVCGRAVATAPESSVARNNLGLAFAARGDFSSASAEFERATVALAPYNLGIVYLASHKYAEAVVAFDAALTLNPSSTLAAERARQARTSAVAQDGPRDRR
jgi:tetratricopeptide (TPR) repeat protein